jgi:isoleucyl-tRNA synthetase
LAEAEVEYEDHISPSIYVKFKLDGISGEQLNRLTGTPANRQTDVFLVIWTTTPWTLLANVAVAVHPDFTYTYIDTEKGRLIIAKDLLSRVLEQTGITIHNII